jgi:hypothetical protein
MFDSPAYVLRPSFYKHLTGKLESSPYSSWTSVPRLVIGRAKDWIALYDEENVFVSIMITSYFTKTDIYHVTDIMKVGLVLETNTTDLWPHEYLVHGPVAGTGFMTFDISTFKKTLGPVWDGIETMVGWYAWQNNYNATLTSKQRDPREKKPRHALRRHKSSSGNLRKSRANMSKTSNSSDSTSPPTSTACAVDLGSRAMKDLTLLPPRPSLIQHWSNYSLSAIRAIFASSPRNSPHPHSCDMRGRQSNSQSCARHCYSWGVWGSG